MPVADETFGGTPRPISNGLKITPPPNPRAPATHPATKPSPRTIFNVLPSKIRSDSTKLIFPNSYLSFYSFATNLDPITTNTTIKIRKTAKRILSPAEHFSNPGLPLRIDVIISTTRATKLIPCFFQIP